MGLVVLSSQLAWRNLWRNHRRTLIMLAAIVLGTSSMIFMTSMMRGLVDQMIHSGLRALPGHVQVHHPDYRDDPTVVNRIPALSPAMQEVLGDDDVLLWAHRVRVPAVVTSERDTRGVTLLGIDPKREAGLSSIGDQVTEGRALESRDDSGLVLGRKLLERLETDVGKRVVVMSQDPENNIAERGFRIVGVFESELQAEEEAFAIAGEAVVQDLLGIGDESSELAVLGYDYRDVESVLSAVQSAAGDGLEVKAWYELNELLGTMMGVMDWFVFVFVGIIFIALAFGLVNTLVMAVFERTREIGLMLALGMGPRNIVWQVVAESIFLLGLGLLIGNAIAGIFVWTFSDGIDLSAFADALGDFGIGTILYPSLTTSDLVLANVTVLVLGFLASLSPAIRASRLEPIEALAEE